MALISDSELLQAALAGYQRQLADIEDKMTELRRRLGGLPAPAAATPMEPGKNRLSPAARARIAAAQRRRWAKVRAAKKAGSARKSSGRGAAAQASA